MTTRSTDARRAGFDKVVFVVREAILEDFKQTILSRFTDRIEVDYVLQELDQVPDGVAVPADRVKPWGTGHAVLVAAPKVHEPFAVINADDYYGAQSFQLMADYLTGVDNDAHEYCLLGYRLENTLSEHGHVSRGVCQIDEEGYLHRSPSAPKSTAPITAAWCTKKMVPPCRLPDRKPCR